jgi:hypothetical protein
LSARWPVEDHFPWMHCCVRLDRILSRTTHPGRRNPPAPRFLQCDIPTQWQTVQQEEQQDEELRHVSNQILELTKPIHAMSTRQPDGSANQPCDKLNSAGYQRARSRENHIAPSCSPRVTHAPSSGTERVDKASHHRQAVQERRQRAVRAVSCHGVTSQELAPRHHIMANQTPSWVMSTKGTASIRGHSFISSRTRGMTCRPNSSMLVMRVSWGSPPAPYFRSKRLAPSVRRLVTIFWATVSGDPT